MEKLRQYREWVRVLLGTALGYTGEISALREDLSDLGKDYEALQETLLDTLLGLERADSENKDLFEKSADAQRTYAKAQKAYAGQIRDAKRIIQRKNLEISLMKSTSSSLTSA